MAAEPPSSSPNMDWDRRKSSDGERGEAGAGR